MVQNESLISLPVRAVELFAMSLETVTLLVCVITGRRMPNGSKVRDIADSNRRFDVTTSIGQIQIR